MTRLPNEWAFDRADDLLQESIRERAYRIWEEEGRPDGCEMEHWARAEREVLSRPWLG